MADRWRGELTKLRRAELPADLWDRVLGGPRLDPPPERNRSRVVAAVVALAVFAGAAVVAVRAFGPFGATTRTLAGPAVLAVPARGEAAADFLTDGRPVFVVHHGDGTVSVVDAFSSHRAWGFEELVTWCPSTRQFLEWAHEAHFDEYGRWRSAGPAPSGLDTFAFTVVERDPNGDPASIRVGSIRPPDPGHSAPETDAYRPPDCPPEGGTSNEALAHAVDQSRIFGSPAEAVMAAPDGWIAVWGRLLVSPDGFVQLCASIHGDRCEGGAVVRGIDVIGLLVNVIRPVPGKSAYQTADLWLARVEDGVIAHPAIASFLRRT